MFPTDLASFLELIRQHGPAVYTLMFGMAGSHALLQTLFAGYAAHAGALDYGKLVAVCWLGSFTGDVIRFWIGRRFGTSWLARWPKVEALAKTVARLAGRHHLWMILSHRYPHGIRGVAGFAYGMSSLGWPTFLIMNAIAAGIWAVAVVSAGYAFGQLAETVLQDAASKLGGLLLIAFLALSWFLARRLEQIQLDEAKAETLKPVLVSAAPASASTNPRGGGGGRGRNRRRNKRR